MTDGEFRFTRASIDDHVEKVGVDVRPALEIGMEQVRITDFYRKISAKYPDLFESLVMGPAEFTIQKKFHFPGKGEATSPTFSLSKRGPIFMVPRRIAALDAETELPAISERVVEALKLFQASFPQCVVLRVGLVNDYIFDCGPVDSVGLVRDRFTRVDGASELFIRFNIPTDRYNRIFMLSPVEKRRKTSEGELAAAGFGVKVQVDFNNIDMTQPLDTDKILGILHDAKVFHDKEAFDILNGDGGPQ